KFKVTKLKQANNEWLLQGYAVGSEMLPELGGTTVKAVTHHECSVKKDGNLWTIKVLLDI
ncbi:archease, partial [Candidatus Micrarchaeota archaeon]|nr:archease [Candidatus Micrarchaeota archaeon]